MPAPGKQDLRGIEWYCLWKECQRSIRPTRVLPDSRTFRARHIAADTNRELFAVTTSSRQADVFRAKDWKLLHTFSTFAQIRSTAFSHCGEFISISDGDLRVGYVYNGHQTEPLSVDGGIMGVAFTADQDVVAVLTWQAGRIELKLVN